MIFFPHENFFPKWLLIKYPASSIRVNIVITMSSYLSLSAVCTSTLTQLSHLSIHFIIRAVQSAKTSSTDNVAPLVWRQNPDFEVNLAKNQLLTTYIPRLLIKFADWDPQAIRLMYCFHRSRQRADLGIWYDCGVDLHLILDGRFELRCPWLNLTDRGQYRTRLTFSTTSKIHLVS